MNDTTSTAPESQSPTDAQSPQAEPANTNTANTPAEASAGTEAPKTHHILNGIVTILEGMARQIEAEYKEIAEAIHVLIAKIKTHL